MWFYLLFSAFVVLFGYGLCGQAFRLNSALRCPCSVRVLRSSGIDEDEEQVYVYLPSAYDPYRFNVDVNIDGMITRYHGRY
jgi:hypothetical protein